MSKPRSASETSQNGTTLSQGKQKQLQKKLKQKEDEYTTLALRTKALETSDRELRQENELVLTELAKMNVFQLKMNALQTTLKEHTEEKDILQNLVFALESAMESLESEAKNSKKNSSLKEAQVSQELREVRKELETTRMKLKTKQASAKAQVSQNMTLLQQELEESQQSLQELQVGAARSYVVNRIFCISWRFHLETFMKRTCDIYR